MRITILKNKKRIRDIVDIHIQSFPNFFLTFLGKSFLNELYKGFMNHEKSNILVAVSDGNIVGFLAYSEDISQFYKYLIKKRLFLLGLHSFFAFLKKPSILIRVLRAFAYPKKAQETVKYIELSSIGVIPVAAGKGIGSHLVEALKNRVDFKEYEYIKLETDAENNEYANNFYKRNKFTLESTYTTPEGRKMNEYRYYGREQ